MDFVSVLWIILGIFVVSLGAIILRLYTRDREKRKLMYVIGLMSLSISFFLIGFRFVIYQETNDVIYNIFRWSAAVYSILLFYVLLEQLLNATKKIKFIFRLYLFTLAFSFILLLSNVITHQIYWFSMAVGTIIITIFGIGVLVKYRSPTNLLFLFSIFSSFIAAMILMQIRTNPGITSYFAIYAYFISFFLLGLILYLTSAPFLRRKGIDSYFSIERQLQETTEKLKETQKTFQSLFHEMVDPVVIVDGKGNVLEASNKFFKTLGITKDEIIGHNFLTTPYFDSKTKRKLMKNVLLRLAGKNIPPYEVTTYSKQGEPIPFEIHAGKVQYKGKTVDMAIFRDLRERKKVEKELKESENRYRTVFESTGTAMGLFGDDSVITMVNNEFAQLTGYQKSEIEQRMHWYDFVTAEDKNRMLSYHQQRTTHTGNPPNEYDCHIIDKQGKVKSVHISLGVVPETSTRIVSLMDVTTLKEAQQGLKNLNKNLENEVEKRTAEIKKLLKQKDDFVNQLGHDLKNPISPLLNLIPILEKKNTDPELHEIYTVINRNLSHMKNLITKTIQLAQLNAPGTTLNYEPVNLLDEFDEILKKHSIFFKQNNIEIEMNIKENLTIDVDKLRFHELIDNLLNNAVKYSPNGGTINLDFEKTNDTLTISIKDEGQGMNPIQLDHVFDEFYKADGSRHDFESSGLGMPIAKRIVDMHGGRIWAESEGIGKGSCFHFTLPLNNLNEKKHDTVTTNNLSIHQAIDSLIHDEK